MNANSFTVPAFAKINWFLNILGKRDDGFHEICTVFQTVSLCDYISFSENDEIILTCDVSSVPIDETNLIIRVAKVLKQTFNVQKGARIHLEKKIPSPGGLGGGSSDAAITLLSLAKLWNIEISLKELCKMGEKLGSDIPFFFFGGTAAGTGRGTEITQINDVEEDFLIIVTPQINVATADAYKELNLPYLTNETSKSILKICFDEVEKLKSKQLVLQNDFEKVIFKINPEIESVKTTLQNNGAKHVLMSGSGASVFAIFDNEETRQATLKAINNQQDWRQFAVATISRNKYREALKEVLTVVSDQFL